MGDITDIRNQFQCKTTEEAYDWLDNLQCENYEFKDYELHDLLPLKQIATRRKFRSIDSKWNRHEQ